MREAAIEAAACLAARARGWLAYKFTSPGRRSVPDRIFVKAGRVVFIEMKTPDGVLTPGQEREIGKLRAQKAEVYVCRSVDDVIEILEPQDAAQN